MAAPVFNVDTPIAWLQRLFGDSGSLVSLTEGDYLDVVAQTVTGVSQTYPFALRGGGIFRCDSFGSDDRGTLLLFDNEDEPFTGENDVTYDVRCTGTIKATGTISVSTIGVSGIAVDLTEFVPAACDLLLVRLGQHEGRSTMQDTMTPGENPETRVRRLASYWRGFR